MNHFHSSWRRAWHGVGAVGNGESLRDELLSKYGDATRAYHSTQHLFECLDAFEHASHLAEEPSIVELALWFHDAIYDPTRSDNEEKSAEWAIAALTGAGAAAAGDRVRSLVLATKHTAAPRSGDECVLIDIDLGVLGAPESRFREYEEQIRSEYSFVPEDLFRQKRGEILQSFLARTSIYSTEHFRLALEAHARANLAEALRANANRRQRHD